VADSFEVLGETMNWKILIAFLLVSLPVFSQTDTQWVLEQSTLSYHMSHPMHE
jgi:hypothetical protein